MPSPLQDYVTYWMHRMYHLPSLYRDGHHDHSNDSANWTKLTFANWTKPGGCHEAKKQSLFIAYSNDLGVTLGVTNQ